MKRDQPVWALVMFDLSVDTKQHRTDATRYRTYLLNLGFSRIQLSVYAKYLINGEGLTWICSRIGHEVPEGGHVRLIAVTDTEWVNSIKFEGKKRVKPEGEPTQLMIF